MSTGASASWSWGTFEHKSGDTFGAFGDASDEEDEAGEDGGYSSRDSLVILIDAQQAMTVETEGEVPLANALKIARLAVEDKIIVNENDFMCIILYGTRDKKNPQNFPGVYILKDMDNPGIDFITEIDKLVDADPFPLGHADNAFAFKDVIWAAANVLKGATKAGQKRLWLITNDDNPNGDDTNAQEQAKKRIKDLEQLDIDVDLFAFNRPDHAFNVHRFFSGVLTRYEDEGTPTFHAISKFREMMGLVRSKEFKKRSAMTIPFTLFGDTQIGVKVYNMIIEAKVGAAYKWLDAKSNEPVKSATAWICAATGAALAPHQMGKYYPYGGDRIPFTEDEIKRIKGLAEPGMVLMGFKPREALKFFHNVRHSQFIFPDDEIVKGSVRVFAALLDRMVALDKIGIARLVPRQGAPPRFVALLPQAEERAEDGEQLQPPGLQVIPLPFADDLRALDKGAVSPASDDQIAAAKKVIKLLDIPEFTCSAFSNPSIQTHYANLQAMALNREPEEVPDVVLPDIPGMLAVGSDALDEFRDAIYPAGFEAPTKKIVAKATTARKRKADDDDGGPGKKAKVDITAIDWLDLASKGMLKKQTVPALKDYLMSEGVKGTSKMKKDELVDAVMRHLGLPT